ncbi:MAG: glycoside hydrolase family 108 protein [Flavobacteriaceae bacterium]|nr:glycoside hydrolase family 108 protein [Flavobacteriaceae bacterium]
MKGNFESALAMVLKHEGGFVDHPRDPGGATNMGVTLGTYEQWMGRSVTIEEMKALTFDDVAPIYRKNYWDRVRGDDLPSGVDWSVFDWAVNSGPSRSAKALQKIVMVTRDGAIGPKTLYAVANQEPDKIIDAMHTARQRFYERLSTFDTFGRGWSRRNTETRDAALLMAR